MNSSRRSFLRSSAAFPAAMPLGATLPFILSACSSGGDSSYLGKSEVSKWNDVFIKAVRAGTLGPPMVARAMAIVNTAIFDAWTATTIKALPTQTGIGRATFAATTERLNTMVAFAAYRALVNLYPAQKAVFDAEMAARGLDINDVSETTATPAGVGNAAAARVLAFRSTDGSNQKGDLAPGAYADYTGYAPVNTLTTINDPTRWQPLRFANGKAPSFLVPHWGSVIPFSMANGASLRPIVTVPSFTSVEYKENVDYVLGLTTNLTDEQKVIAEYWANGPASETPPGQWNVLTQWVSEKNQNSLAADVQLFFAVSNALMDAGITCWDCKRHYDTVRPVTAIRTLYSGKSVIGFRGAAVGQGIGAMQGEVWHPYQSYNFTTPPFAEFTSGHSTFSSASAEVLRLLTGSDDFGYSVTIKSGDPTALLEANVPAQPTTLSFATFSGAAEQAGISRLYGGIHFPAGNNFGLSSGKKVGQAVVDRMNVLLQGELREFAGTSR